MIRPPPRSTLFPYTTLFRSLRYNLKEYSPNQLTANGFLRTLRSVDPPAGDTRARVHRVGRACTFRGPGAQERARDRKSTGLNSSHGYISYAVFCLKKKKT